MLSYTFSEDKIVVDCSFVLSGSLLGNGSYIYFFKEVKTYEIIKEFF